MTTKTYNGHKNWNYWNVVLWIANDEGLYCFAKDCLRSHRNRRDAARAFVEDVNEGGGKERHLTVPVIPSPMSTLQWRICKWK